MKSRTIFRLALLAVCCSAIEAGIAGAAPLVTDTNLLSGLAASPANFGVSSYYNDGGAPSIYGLGGADYGPQNATNALAGGPGADFVFDPGDGSQRAAITGFNSAVNDIRIWSGDLRPLQVTIKSSTTSKTSVNPGDYSTTLYGPASILGTAWISSGGHQYADFLVSAPAGTQSLLFNFGTGQDTTGSPGFARISELQAFAPVPEPASIVLLGLGAMGLFIAARRRRKA